MSLLQLGLCMLWCTKLGWQEANQWQIMTAVFSHVKFSGQRCCIFDKLWYFFQCCSSSSEFHSNAEACAVMNDCNQCNIFFPKKVQPNFSWQTYIQCMSVCEKQNCIEDFLTWIIMTLCMSETVCAYLSAWHHMTIENRSSPHLGHNPWATCGPDRG